MKLSEAAAKVWDEIVQGWHEEGRPLPGYCGFTPDSFQEPVYQELEIEGLLKPKTSMRWTMTSGGFQKARLRAEEMGLSSD